MVDITELHDDEADDLGKPPISDDVAAAMSSPTQGWIMLAKNFRERGNTAHAKKDFEGAALAYRQGVDNITIILHKNIGDEDEPYVVKKSEVSAVFSEITLYHISCSNW